MTTRQVGLLMAVITGLCWATLAIALRQALLFASTGTIVWFRMVVAFLILIIYYAITDRKSLSILWRPSFLSIVAGCGLALNYFAYMKGIELTNASNAQIMIQLGPISLLVIGIAYFKEKPSRLQTFGLGFGAIGFVLFFWDQILVSVTNMSQFIAGDIWLVFAAVAWAIFATIQKISIGRWRSQQFNLLIYGICLVALFPSSKPQEILTWTPSAWILMIACGLNTLVAYGAFAEALKRIPASHISLIISANPLLTIFLVTTLGAMQVSWVTPEIIHWRGFLGAIFVVLGVSLTVWRNSPRMSEKLA